MTQCKICYAIETTDKEDSDAIKDALTSSLVTNVELADVLTRNNFPVSETSVRRHQRHMIGNQ